MGRTNVKLREGLTPLPTRMERLALDDRGYPVPWFVQWLTYVTCQICKGSGQSTDELTGCADDKCPGCGGFKKIGLPSPYGEGVAEFRAMDPSKRVIAIQKKLCWVCGERLGTNFCFVAGPMCGINRTSAEPPCHLECGQWSAINCPFLSNPRTVRREDEQINNQTLRENTPGMAITRNPGVTMLWVTRSFEIFDDNKGGQLIQMGEPDRVEWYKEGLLATHTEVMSAVRSGLPSLYNIASQQEGAMKFLEDAVARFLAYVPPINVHLPPKH